MNSIRKICSFLLLVFTLLSCRTQEVAIKQLQPIEVEVLIKANTDSLKNLSRVYDYRNGIIDKQQREIHLLRVEIDALKKKLKTQEVIRDIDKLQYDLNKITKQ